MDTHFFRYPDTYSKLILSSILTSIFQNSKPKAKNVNFHLAKILKIIILTSTTSYKTDLIIKIYRSEIIKIVTLINILCTNPKTVTDIFYPLYYTHLYKQTSMEKC